MAPPRFHGASIPTPYALDAAFDGLTQGLARPHNGSLASQLHQGVEGARSQRAEGLLHATPAFCAETLLVSDLLLLGSASACSESSLMALHEALRDRKTVGPQQVVEILNEHAAQRGLGAAVIAVVIEDSRPVT